MGFWSKKKKTSPDQVVTKPPQNQARPNDQAPSTNNPKPQSDEQLEARDTRNYPYRNLDPTTEEIRVFEIHPGGPSAALICSLHHKSLVGNTTIEYESISYCWGELLNERAICVDGVWIYVRWNAAEVLRRMRFPDRRRIVWIDTICINQNKSEEKNVQVALMAKIYSRGVSNLIWLGDNPGGVTWASQLANTVRAVLKNADEATKKTGGFYETVCPGGRRKGDGALLDRTIDLSPLVALYWSPWFTRVWVIQEAVLATSSHCYYGDARINLENILTTAAWLCYNGTQLPNPFLKLAGVYRAAGMWLIADCVLIPSDYHARVKRDLSWLYLITQEAQATNPKDKVYGLLGMFEQDARSRIQLLKPEYGIHVPVMKVFRDATIFMIEDSGSLVILQAQQTDLRSRDPNWPSWTVDFARRWSDTEDAIMIDPFHADSGVKLRLEPRDGECDDNELTVRGILVDTIAAHTISMESRFSLSNPLVTSWLASTGELAITSCNSKRPDFLRDVAFTLIGGTNWLLQPAAQNEVRDFKMLLEYLRHHPKQLPPRAFQSSPEHEPETWSAGRYWHALGRTCHGRCFFATRTGLMGVGPRGMQKSDIVAVLFGSDVLFVLRPVGKDQFKLVGGCYVQGIMNGEAVRHQQRTGGGDRSSTLV